MKLIDVRHVLTSFSFLTLGALALTACKGSAADDRPVVIMNVGGDGGFQGCVQPNFPPDQPDLSVFRQPLFITENSNGQATARPGDEIEAEITVNAATRYARIELKDAWFAPGQPIAVDEINTAGNDTLDVLLATEASQRFGRFYMKITLCGLDCDDQEVVFDLNPDINSDYERTLYEDGVLIQTDRTCLDFIPGGTVLIQ
ncbi:MAG: hypothetical protein OER77_02830 [Myxococcales bacterium]|nr:hypothetical protein [Myxococcales bacterium]